MSGRAHHVTQRGNRREAIFFEEGDQSIYLDLLSEQCARYEVQIWAYCLMPNHVLRIVVPARLDGLGRAIGETHRRYTNFINARGRWTGHLFQSRFSSVLLDDDHFVRAIRYVSLNPVRARLVTAADEWPWSSVRAHFAGVEDALVKVEPILARIPHLKALLEQSQEDDFSELRRAESTGRPLATPECVVELEIILGRTIARRAQGREALDRTSPTNQMSLL